MTDIEAANAATIEDRDKTIRRVYHGKDGGCTAYKTYLDAKPLDPRITLEWVRDWFKKNVERTTQVGGARKIYVAPHAFLNTNGPFSSQINFFQIKTIQLV